MEVYFIKREAFSDVHMCVFDTITIIVTSNGHGIDDKFFPDFSCAACTYIINVPTLLLSKQSLNGSSGLIFV